jgi:hypothetical protein
VVRRYRKLRLVAGDMSMRFENVREEVDPYTRLKRVGGGELRLTGMDR